MNCTFIVCLVLLLSSQTCANDESANGKENEWCLKDYILYALLAVVGCIVTVAVSQYGLALLTEAEIAANPIAVLVHCVVYGGVVAGNIFEVLVQSIAYVTGGSSTRAGLVGFMAVAGFALWFMYPRQKLMESNAYVMPAN